MKTIFLYQFSDFTFHEVDLKAKMPVYIKQAEKVTNNIQDVTCRWVVRSKPSVLLVTGDKVGDGTDFLIVEKG